MVALVFEEELNVAKQKVVLVDHEEQGYIKQQMVTEDDFPVVKRPTDHDK